MHRFIGVTDANFFGSKHLNVEARIRTTKKKGGHGALAPDTLASALIYDKWVPAAWWMEVGCDFGGHIEIAARTETTSYP